MREEKKKAKHKQRKLGPFCSVFHHLVISLHFFPQTNWTQIKLLIGSLVRFGVRCDAQEVKTQISLNTVFLSLSYSLVISSSGPSFTFSSPHCFVSPHLDHHSPRQPLFFVASCLSYTHTHADTRWACSPHPSYIYIYIYMNSSLIHTTYSPYSQTFSFLFHFDYNSPPPVAHSQQKWEGRKESTDGKKQKKRGHPLDGAVQLE